MATLLKVLFKIKEMYDRYHRVNVFDGLSKQKLFGKLLVLVLDAVSVIFRYMFTPYSIRHFLPVIAIGIKCKINILKQIGIKSFSVH